MASNEKWKSVSVNIDTYAKIKKIAQDEDRKIGQQISNLVKKEYEKVLLKMCTQMFAKLNLTG